MASGPRAARRRLLKTRKQRLELYLQSANGVLAKMCWLGRLDELRVFGKSPENGQRRKTRGKNQ
jgi:hypothetical protein